MKFSKKLFLLALSTLMVFSISACMKTKQARTVETKTVLVDRSILKAGEDGEALLRYINKKADFKKYTKVMIDPVMMFKPKNASKEEQTDLKALSANSHAYLLRELSKDYKIVKDPSPGTLKIQTAILDAESSSPAMDTLSSVVPFGVAISIVKDFATGKPSAVGEITGEVKITDAITGDLVGAAVDRRVGGKGMGGLFESWNDANAGMEYWAKKIRYALCDERKGTNCVKPNNY